MVVGFIDDTDAVSILMQVFPTSKVIGIQTSFQYLEGVAASSCCFQTRLRQDVVPSAGIVSFYPQRDITTGRGVTYCGRGSFLSA